MSAKTEISWTDATWNPVRGCSLVSPGCTNCYAMRVAYRFNGIGMPYEGLTKMTAHGPAWTGKVRLVPDLLDDPLRWKKPRRIFVNSMSDLFHDDVPDEFIDQVFAVMALCPQHTFQILTKRPERMLRYCRTDDSTNQELEPDVDGEATRDCFIEGAAQSLYAKLHPGDDPSLWLAVHQPLPNVWLGVSVEDQQRANERIPLLLETPAAVRFLSCEPLLEAINIKRFMPKPMFHCMGCGRELMHDHCAKCGTFDNTATNQIIGVDWVIVGGESGSNAREFVWDWARDILRECREAGVPFFMKQTGTDHARLYDRAQKNRSGADPAEWAADLRVQEFPT